MKALTDYILHLGDNALILGQRNSEWCGHGPVLEQDIAITNISLDLVGQARYFYQYAAQLTGNNATEDTMAYLRPEREFRNCLLVEQENGDWGQTILRQFFFSSFQFLLFTELVNSRDKAIGSIAEKAIKEVTYHLRWSSEWVIRLGDGTAESHQRMRNAIEALWTYTGELFIATGYEKECIPDGTAADLSLLKEPWLDKIKSVFKEATLPVPEHSYMQTGGKTGIHTESLGYILADMQYLQRAYPGCEW